MEPLNVRHQFHTTSYIGLFSQISQTFVFFLEYSKVGTVIVSHKLPTTKNFIFHDVLHPIPGEDLNNTTKERSQVKTTRQTGKNKSKLQN
jgi:hypothetical protein